MTMTITSGVDHGLVGRISRELKARPRQNLVGGRWVDSEGGQRFATHNPATGEVLAELPRSTAADVDRAAQAARAAFADDSAWPRMPPAERSKLIWRVGS
jgi:acyl-CoA reductase-like NAD-dependent aldehyde dehydrogenase